MVLCLTSARFNMNADIWRQTDGTTVPTVEGTWKSYQDPITGEIIRRWVPVDSDTGTVGDQVFSMDCLARGITGSGIRGAGTTEDWGQLYEDVEYVKLSFPSSIVLSQRDRVTNIRDVTNKILWLEEEAGPTAGVFKSTVFKVLGVIPIVDPFGRHSENWAMLERADVQPT